MSVPLITLTFFLQDILGSVNQGSVVFTLIYPPGIINPGGIARVPGTAIVVNFVREVFADVNGFISIPIWGNDLLTPGPDGSFYALTFKDDAGSTICTIPYQFNGSGVQDLSNIAPFTGAPSITPLPPNAVVTNPTGQQAILGFPLLGAFAGLQIVPSSATPVFDAKNQGSFENTLTQNVTASTLNNASPGQYIGLDLIQNGAGLWTFAFPANIKNAMQPDKTANARTCYLFRVASNGNAYPVSAPTLN